MTELLPLFPLDLVLLPGASQPLHIFEPRYREMIADCLAGKKAFGIVRAQEKEQRVSDVGCTAEIVSIVNKYPDGRMDILTRGLQRFEVIRVDQTLSYAQAEVVYLQDISDTPSQTQANKAIELQSEILALMETSAQSSHRTEGLLSFQLASSLPIDLDFKQNLLTINSEVERIELLISFFEAILPNLRRAVNVRKKASGNGHAL